jgi:DNA repair exonuclease SbcCD ATPase subunit
VKILSAELQGFRSFTAPQVIDFTALKSGLYHVTGDMGAGKSSLFEGLHWACYGKTSRGLRAGSVKNWNSNEQCAVILNVEGTVGPFALFRSWDPNALEVDQLGKTRPVDQQELETMLGMGLQAFTLCIYFPQIADAFVDIDPAKQTAIFSDILRLGVWEDAAKKSTERADEVNVLIYRMKEDLARFEGQAEELMRLDYTEQEAEWERGRAVAVAQAQATLTSATVMVRACGAAVQAAALKAKAFEEAKVKERAHDQTLQAAKADCQRAKQKVQELERKDIKTCPSCGGPIDSSHIKKELAKAQKALKEAVDEVSKLANTQVTLSEAVGKFNYLETERLEAAAANASALAGAKTAKAALDKLKNDINPYVALREDQDKRGQQLVESIDLITEALANEQRNLGALQFWAKGFKEIRLGQIQDSLAQLTLECNEVLFQLGLQDWSIDFAVERENKSGTISRSFTTMIKAPGAPAAVPWEVWSGGEAQRLRIAISMGFSNLIAARSGISPNLEMWDEPTAGLTQQGIQDLLEVLADRARRYNRIILLADHRSFEFGGFAGKLAVVKGKEGSVINVS